MKSLFTVTQGIKMQSFTVFFLLVAFSAVSDCTHVRHLLRLNFLLEENRAEKRTVKCSPEEYDKVDGCSYFKASGYCKEGSQFYTYVQKNCYASCGNCEMPPTPPPEVNAKACLDAHNAKRTLHRAPDLLWNSTLALHAKKWAEKLVAEGELKHAETDEGENIFKGRGPNAFTCIDAVNNWYGEEPNYPYNDPPETREEFYVKPTFGHFTQLVWKATKQVGVGLATNKTADGYTETIIVARYWPKGNILGQFPANVSPEK